jgi:amidophosphoribosyltransferase
MCGIIGIFGDKDVAGDIYISLLNLQHRGQDASGMVTFSNRFNLKKGYGLVRDVFKKKNFSYLRGNIGIGHVRYPTIGRGETIDAQPFLTNIPYGIALAHNGNLINFYSLKKELEKDRLRVLNSMSDSELILNFLADEISKQLPFSIEGLFKAIKAVFGKLRGSYSVVAFIKDKGMLAFRDPNGIKPIIFGVKGNNFAVASESVALQALGFEIKRDILPGEVIFADINREIHNTRLSEEKHYPCIFEYVYFARPDSILDGISVYEARLNLGRELSKKIKEKSLDVDVIIPVPDTSRPAAVALAEELGIKYREGLMKNRYFGRTFIMPDQRKRRESVRIKLSPIKEELFDKKVMLVDDSIVRGNTSKEIIKLVREAGVREVHLAISSPPLRYPCYYGIDMQTRGEFIARENSEEEIKEIIGADSLIYQSVEGLINAVSGGEKRDFCTACFTADYPIHITESELKRIEYDRINK